MTETRMHSSRMRTVRCSGCLGGCLPKGGCLPRGISQHALGQTPPPPPALWTKFLTHASENITVKKRILLKTFYVLCALSSEHIVPMFYLDHMDLKIMKYRYDLLVDMLISKRVHVLIFPSR